MKKIFMLLATTCAFASCDPEQEDFSNGGHITADQLKSMSTVTVDKAASGLNGNVITCSTSAPVNAKWDIGGKELLGNYAWKKMKMGDYTIVLTGLCADGTVVTADFPISCQEITNPLEKFWIYGEDPAAQAPFKPGAWDAAAMRFSDNEGKFTDVNGNPGFLPYLSDDVYWGGKTLIFDVSDADPGTHVRIMNGWWSARYKPDDPALDNTGGLVFFNTNGLWELPLTEEIAKDCARGNGGGGRDLDIMLTSGSCTINGIYYEE